MPKDDHVMNTMNEIKGEFPKEHPLNSVVCMLNCFGILLNDIRESLWKLEELAANSSECVVPKKEDPVPNKEDLLVEKYGEYVDKAVAARILGVTRATVYAMLADGRITGAFGGNRVNVRSIARHINNPGKPNPKWKWGS